MPKYLSAGVTILEQDLSTSISAPATSTAAFVGRAYKGPVKQRILVSSEQEFFEKFGPPMDFMYSSNGDKDTTRRTAEDFFTVSSFLQYGNTLLFDREVDAATAKNAAVLSTTSTTLSGGQDYIQDWTNYTPTFSTEKFKFFAKYPGYYGNTDIEIGLVNQTQWNNLTTLPSSGWDATTQAVSSYKQSIEYGPSKASEYVVVVKAIQPDGSFSIAETFLVSDDITDQNFQGDNIYINQLINSGSKYILAFNNSSVTGMAASFGDTKLTGGYDGTFSESDIVSGYDLFANPEEVEINFLIGGNHTGSGIPNDSNMGTPQHILSVAETRADCFAILDCPKSDVVGISDVSTAVANVIDYKNNHLNDSKSFGAIYTGWLYVYDKYNDLNRWIPCSGHVAGIYAYTANTADTWWAPAGLNRGVLKNVIKLSFNPGKAYRDQLYQNQINPLVSFPGQGIVVWGQKTLQTKPSAFDRVNVRLLFNYMEKAIAKASMYVVFEFNDNLTQTIFKNMVVPFLEDIKGRRGVYDFLVDVGSKVNTPEVVDANAFKAKIFIKPTRVAEFLEITFIATKTGVDFQELQ